MKNFYFKIFAGVLIFIFAFPLALKALSYLFKAFYYLFNQYISYLNMFFGDESSILIGSFTLGLSFIFLLAIFVTFIIENSGD